MFEFGGAIDVLNRCNITPANQHYYWKTLVNIIYGQQAAISIQHKLRKQGTCVKWLDTYAKVKNISTSKKCKKQKTKKTKNQQKQQNKYYLVLLDFLRQMLLLELYGHAT